MDAEILRLKERVQIAVEVGESHFREFKSAYEGPHGNKRARNLKEICYDIARTLVAFANADGGELYVGIEDDSTITGVSFSEREINYLLDAPHSYVHKDTPLTSFKKALIDIDGKKVLFFAITKGVDFVYITADGKCLQRKDLESVPISPAAIQFSRQEKESREYDRQFVDAGALKDLALDVIGNFAKELYKISAEKFLQYLELGEFDGGNIRLKRAALLLFSKEPTRWHPRLQVRVIRVNGTELLSGKDYNVTVDDVVSGSIVMLIESSWELLRPHLVETKFTPDALFKTQVMYPELACREALINAIAHRDYSNEGRGVEIYVFDDRIEFISPGELLSSIKLSDIKQQTGAHQSRNTHIARTLREIGYMRELGEGFKRIYKLLDDNELAPPDIGSENGIFRVTMFQKTIYTRDEQLWLDNFEGFLLTRDEKAVVRMGYKGELLSPKNIWDMVGIVDTDYYRQILESLKKKGILVSKVSKGEAMRLARSRKIDKKSVPRFLIGIPEKEVTNILKANVATIETPTQIMSELDDSEYAKIYIANLPCTVTRDDIFALFSDYGDIVSIELPLNSMDKPRGYGFIEFDSLEYANKSYEDRHNIYLGGRKVHVQHYKFNSVKTTSSINPQG